MVIISAGPPPRGVRSLLCSHPSVCRVGLGLLKLSLTFRKACALPSLDIQLGGPLEREGASLASWFQYNVVLQDEDAGAGLTVGRATVPRSGWAVGLGVGDTWLLRPTLWTSCPHGGFEGCWEVSPPLLKE